MLPAPPPTGVLDRPTVDVSVEDQRSSKFAEDLGAAAAAEPGVDRPPDDIADVAGLYMVEGVIVEGLIVVAGIRGAAPPYPLPEPPIPIDEPPYDGRAIG